LEYFEAAASVRALLDAAPWRCRLPEEDRMSWFRNVMGVAALAVLAVSVGCGSSSSSSSTTTPSPVTYTETYSGSLAQGGSTFFTDPNTGATYVVDYGTSDAPHHFTVHQAGNLDATLTDIQPVNSVTLGLGLGIWDSTAQSCSLQLTSSAAKLNLTLAASVSVAGELCVGVYDVQNLSSAINVTYTVTINHT
jgi:hypothetical protein